MSPLIRSVFDFAADQAVWFVAGSLLSLIASLVLTPLLILAIPADYFAHPQRHKLVPARHPLLRLLLIGIKNVVGYVLIVAGIALLVLPGQGVITLLAGLLITNYPGKFGVERWLVRRRHVLPAMNWLRARYGRPPLLAPP